MKRVLIIAIAAVVLGSVGHVALAQDVGAESPGGSVQAPSESKVLGKVGACIAAGIIILGGSFSIAKIGSRAVESIARQPEAAGQMFLAWLLPAAMIEGAMLFGVVLCLLALG